MGRCNKVASKALVFAIKGLFKSWKQPIGYFLTGSSLSSAVLEILLNVCLDKLSDISFSVRLVVCDQTGVNCGLFKRLDISSTKPWFEHNNKKNFASR